MLKLPPRAWNRMTSSPSGRSTGVPSGTRRATTVRWRLSRSRCPRSKVRAGISGEAFSAPAVISRAGIIELDLLIETFPYKSQGGSGEQRQAAGIDEQGQLVIDLLGNGPFRHFGDGFQQVLVSGAATVPDSEAHANAAVASQLLLEVAGSLRGHGDGLLAVKGGNRTHLLFSPAAGRLLAVSRLDIDLLGRHRFVHAGDDVFQGMPGQGGAFDPARKGLDPGQHFQASEVAGLGAPGDQIQKVSELLLGLGTGVVLQVFAHHRGRGDRKSVV